MHVYKIRRTIDGLYSNAGAGGMCIHFSEIGKTWNHLRHAVQHIKSNSELCGFFNRISPYAEGCEIVVFDLVEITAAAPPQNALKRPRTVVRGKVR